ncbi:MAG: helix-turn-helix domain-containing protein [Ekhidna sp.]|uniref:helix-turn-helix domain-containing protein n=1 Tax=Reichenbachiella sp. TaxID=2184521 RepID=UPI003263FCB9
MKSGKSNPIDSYIDERIAQTSEQCLDRYVKEHLIPFLGIYCRGDPLQTYTTEDVAGYLKVSESTVRRLERTGKLPAFRISEGKRSRLRFRGEDVRMFQLNQLKQIPIF